MGGLSDERFLRRVQIELRRGSVPEEGIYLCNDVDEFMSFPITLDVVLISMHPDSAPYLLRVTYPSGYPFAPIGVKFLTHVPHPLIGQDGSVNLDADWTPAYTVQTILVLMQSVLTEPFHSDVQNSGCVVNSTWQSERVDTPQQFRPQLFRHLLKATHAEDTSLTGNDWVYWRCLRAIRNFMVNYHGVQVPYRQAWYEFLRSLATQFLKANRRRSQNKTAHSSNFALRDQADILWVREAQTLLDKFFRTDALRILVMSRALGLNMGQLQRVPGSRVPGLWGVWKIIRSFVSDIEDVELFAGNPILLRCVEELSRGALAFDRHRLLIRDLRCNCLDKMAQAPLVFLSRICCS